MGIRHIVEAGPAVHLIAAIVSIEPVVPGTAKVALATRCRKHGIASTAAYQHIIPALAIERVIALVTDQHVGVAATADVLEVGYHIPFRLAAVGLAGRQVDISTRGRLSQQQHIAAGAAVEHIGTGATSDHVVAIAAVNAVVALEAFEHVVACATEQHIIARATLQRVLAGAAVEGVVARIAAQVVITRSGIDGIVTLATKEILPRPAAVQRIALRITDLDAADQYFAGRAVARVEPPVRVTEVARRDQVFTQIQVLPRLG